MSASLGCETCGKTGAHLLKCANCRYTLYCDPSCQRKDWKKHKSVCAPRRTFRKTVQEQRHARQDRNCGACHKDLNAEVRANPDVANRIAPLGCGHVAHMACLRKRSDVTCPTCGQLGDIFSHSLPLVLQSLRCPWYEEDSPEVLFQMALGYIFQAEIFDRTGKDGSVQAEQVFIDARKALVPDFPELMASLRRCMEEQARLSTPMGEVNTNGTPLTPQVLARIRDQKVTMTVLLLTPFLAAEADRENFLTYVIRWVQTLGM